MANLRTVYIDGYGPVDLTPKDQIGVGGLGIVFKSLIGRRKNPTAIKVWKNMTPETATKIDYMVKNADKWTLPELVFMLKATVRDSKGSPNVLGATMDLLDPSAREFGILLNRKVRRNEGVTDKNVADIFALSFEELYAILKHLIVVDINPRNLVFLLNTMQVGWLDTDSWWVQGKQFGEKLVYTEGYVDHFLIGPSAKQGPPIPKPQHAIYSLATLFWQATLGVPPYGGTHDTLNTDRERIMARAWALDSNVIIPSFCQHPEVLSDDLLDAFEDIFVNDKRDALKPSLVRDYANSLTECPSCHTWYSSTRHTCPSCQLRTAVPMTIPSAIRAKLREKINAGYPIVSAAYLQADKTLVVVANHNGTLYVHNDSGALTKLFKFESGLRYEFINSSYLAVNRGSNREIEVWDITGNKASMITTTASEPFASNHDRVAFRGSDGHLVRIAGRAFMRASLESGSRLVDRRLPIRASQNQTWFWSDQNRNVHLVLMQIFDLDQFSLIAESKRIELPTSTDDDNYQDDGSNMSLSVKLLNSRERLVDMSVNFGQHSVLIRRLTQEGAKSFLRTEVVTHDGAVVLSSRMATSQHESPIIRGVGYSDVDARNKNSTSYTVWHPTDEGILREELGDNINFSKLTRTQGAVTASDDLVHLGFASHFLVVREQSVDYLVLK